MRPIIFWGATGQARVLHEFVSQSFDLLAVFDNNESAVSPFPGVPIFHGVVGFKRWRAEHPAGGISFLVAIGGDHGHDRLIIHDLLRADGLEPVTAIHSTAFVASDARLGAGCQVLAQAAVCAGAVLGRETIVNTAASVDHQCELGDGVHVAPGARLAGEVRVGDYTMIGMGAIVLPRVTIGSNVVIGAGSLVLHDIPANSTAHGSPARVVKPRRKVSD